MSRLMRNPSELNSAKIKGYISEIKLVELEEETLNKYNIYDLIHFTYLILIIFNETSFSKFILYFIT